MGRRLPSWSTRAAATGWSSRRRPLTRSGSSRSSLSVKNLSPVETVSALREALAAWRPPAPFADLQDTAYPAAEAARLVELRGSAGEALVAACLDGSDPVAAAAEAEAQLRDDPYRERLWELLVLALYRQGRQGDALEAYRRARAELSDGLGVDPDRGCASSRREFWPRIPACLRSRRRPGSRARTRVWPATTPRTPTCSSGGSGWWTS